MDSCRNNQRGFAMAFDLLTWKKAQIQLHVGVRLLRKQLQIGNLCLVVSIHGAAIATFQSSGRATFCPSNQRCGVLVQVADKFDDGQVRYNVMERMQHDYRTYGQVLFMVYMIFNFISSDLRCRRACAHRYF